MVTAARAPIERGSRDRAAVVGGQHGASLAWRRAMRSTVSSSWIVLRLLGIALFVAPAPACSCDAAPHDDTIDGGGSADASTRQDAREPALDATEAPDASADDDGGPSTTDAATVDAPVLDGGAPHPLSLPFEPIAAPEATGAGIHLPVFPLDMVVLDTMVVVVGDARSALSWRGVEVPAGNGFVLALDRATGDPLWVLAVGDHVDAIEEHDGGLVIAGAFDGELIAGGSRLSSHGQTDGFVAMVSREGELESARAFGSSGHDSAVGLAVRDGAIAVSGFVSGTVDLGAGCGTLAPQPGVWDPKERRLFGVWDAIALLYEAECPWGAVLGAAGADDLGFDVAIDRDTLHVSGESRPAMVIRTTAGMTGGSARGGAFVAHFGREDGAISLDLAIGAGRGRALDIDESSGLLHWGVGSVGDTAEMITGDGAHRTALVPSQTNLITLALDGSSARAHGLGAGTLDLFSIARSESALYVASDVVGPGVALTRIDLDGGTTAIASYRATPATPCVLAHRDAELWLACQTGEGASATIGDPPLDARLESGGFYVVRANLD
jgi:hypothetical protein